jgi:SM-20-related protein
MTKSDFYSSLGLFVEKSFFDTELCERIRREMNTARGRPGRYIKRDKILYDEKVRKTKQQNVSQETLTFVKKRLLELKPLLESHFSKVLRGCQDPVFLYYKKGDFFLPHYDKGIKPENPKETKDREVSVVVFLNSEDDNTDQNSYSGGSLRLYGLGDDPLFKNHGFHIIGNAGMLLAFRSEILHEVTPVKEGERYTVVSWFV